MWIYDALAEAQYVTVLSVPWRTSDGGGVDKPGTEEMPSVSHATTHDYTGTSGRLGNRSLGDNGCFFHS